MPKMSSFMATGLLLLAMLMINSRSDAAIRLPSLIGNNMVLQQNAEIKVWGWADAGEQVNIKASWLSTEISTYTSSDSNWMAILTTPVAGGPYTMKISGRDYSITIENIMIGEVWVCSGQSNMEYTIRGLGGWKNYNSEVRNEVAKGMYSNVRLFRVNRDTSAVALANCKGHWQLADTNTANDFSATAWFYGSYLNRVLGVPIGLISSAWGGTPAEVWMPEKSINEEPDLGYFLNHFNGSSGWPGTPGVLYNAMIHPLVNYKIKGAIWYQGETNRRDATLYPLLMETLIQSWRSAWGNSEMPFYYVQIAPYAYSEPFTGALLREAQLKCLSIPNSGMAVTMDLVDDIYDIHPKNKLDVGKRLALWALSKTYGKPAESFSGPVYNGMEIQDKKIVIRFLYAYNGLKLTGSGDANFRIAGADHVFYPAHAVIKDDQLLVSSPKVKKPVAVRYAFTNTAEATLFNGKGLPASSFRTDDWEIITDNIKLRSFIDPSTKTLSYTLTTNARESDIRYDFGKMPVKYSTLYQNPIPSGRNGILYAKIFRNGYLSETSNSWNIVAHKASGSETFYATSFSKKYAACGNITLLDGILATNDYRDGNWLGFPGNDLEVVIDPGKTIQMKKITMNFLSDNKSWIFLPKGLVVMVSEDGVSYTNIGECCFSNEKEVNEPIIQTVTFDMKCKTRYIKVTALNQKSCPEWHPGSGKECWLFIDEIIVQ